MKQKQSQTLKPDLRLPKGNHGWEGYIRTMEIIYIHYCIKEMVNKDLLYNTGNSTQYSVINYMEKRMEITVTLLCT